MSYNKNIRIKLWQSYQHLKWQKYKVKILKLKEEKLQQVGEPL